MPLPVSLNDVIDAVTPLSDQWQSWINRNTGKIISFSEEEMAASSGDASAQGWNEESLANIREVLSSDDGIWLQLPGPFEFHEYSVMEAFCRDLDNEALRTELLDAIRGSGAFRRFRDRINRHGLDQAWYDWRDAALRQCVIDFLDSEGIPFTEA